MTDDLVKQALAELGDVVRCCCHEAFRDRDLQDPQCNCDSMDAVRVVIARVEWLERERALDAKLLADTQALLDKAEVVMREAADRIQQLEREKREAALDALAAHGQAHDAYEAQLKAEAELAECKARLGKAVEALGKAREILIKHGYPENSILTGYLDAALAAIGEGRK
jgi:hypothetical protein